MRHFLAILYRSPGASFIINEKDHVDPNGVDFDAGELAP